MDFSRIIKSVDVDLLGQTHIVIVGAGGSYSFICALVRMGIGKLTVLDFDTVESKNIVRQGYHQNDIGKYKVDALEANVKAINPTIDFTGVTKNFLEMNDKELEEVFDNTDMFLFLTDSFPAQAFGNILALRFNTPALWSGWYQDSYTAELFFQIPKYTPACFRCATSSRYVINLKGEVKASSNGNTIFHSQLLDALIGMLTMGILHRDTEKKDLDAYLLFESLLEDNICHHNFFQFKGHPLGGNTLFNNVFGVSNTQTPFFNSYWQKVIPELIQTGYDYDCPDCQGALLKLTQSSSNR